MNHWKKYKEATKQVESTKAYTISEAVELLKKTSYAKFDATMEIAVKTYANPKYNDQMLRATTILPNWTWKTSRIAVFVSDDKVADCKKAWADIAWSESVLKDIKEWKFDFDVLITTPDHIRDLAVVAKQLGPKWLMPSPKSGTVVQNLDQAIEEFKKWKIEFKLDKTGNIHAGIWKMSFDAKKLEENIEGFLKAIEDHKPTGVKNKLVKKVVISSSMSPWIQIAY